MVDLVNEGWPEERRCDNCINGWDIACGYGVCGKQFKMWRRLSAPTSDEDILRWFSDNSVDLEESCCDRWDG